MWAGSLKVVLCSHSTHASGFVRTFARYFFRLRSSIPPIIESPIISTVPCGHAFTRLFTRWKGFALISDMFRLVPMPFLPSFLSTVIGCCMPFSCFPNPPPLYPIWFSIFVAKPLLCFSHCAKFKPLCIIRGFCGCCCGCCCCCCCCCSF